MDRSGRVVLGRYLKHDGGVEFELLEDGAKVLFRHRGGEQEVQWEAQGGFRIQWQWGRPLFTRRDPSAPGGEEVLMENGHYAFGLVGPPGPVQLSEEQLHAFKDMGALLVHHAVQPRQCRAALECQEMQEILQEARGKVVHSAHCRAPEIAALAEPMWPEICRIIGSELPLPTGAQVAVRGLRGRRTAAGEVARGVHIDGMHAPDNGIPAKEVRSFTLLLGIALTDVDGPPLQGNFSYIPGSHKALARAANRFPSVDEAVDCLRIAEGYSVQSGIKKLVDVQALAPPLHVICEAGGAYIAHYLTLHFVQPNCAGVMPRVAVYFRVTAPVRQWPRCFLSEHLFDEMPGLPTE